MSCIVVAPLARLAPPALAPCGASLQTLASAGAQALDLAAMGARHCRVAGCSAVTGEGLLGTFEWVVGDVQSRIYLLD